MGRSYNNSRRDILVLVANSPNLRIVNSAQTVFNMLCNMMIIYLVDLHKALTIMLHWIKESNPLNIILRYRKRFAQLVCVAICHSYIIYIKRTTQPLFVRIDVQIYRRYYIAILKHFIKMTKSHMIGKMQTIMLWHGYSTDGQYLANES